MSALFFLSQSHIRLHIDTSLGPFENDLQYSLRCEDRLARWDDETGHFSLVWQTAYHPTGWHVSSLKMSKINHHKHKCLLFLLFHLPASVLANRWFKSFSDIGYVTLLTFAIQILVIFTLTFTHIWLWHREPHDICHTHWIILVSVTV